MATGKSTVGRALAARLGLDFLDTDAIVEQRLGKPIAAVFAEDGEAAFRAAEREAIAEATRRAGGVIATGGGSLAHPANLEAMRAAGPLICLTADPETILRRAGDAESRPLLAGQPEPLEAVRALLEARRPSYQAADLRIDTSALTIEQVVEEICAALPSLWREHPTTS